MKFRCVPLNLSQANQIVDLWHRHHRPCVGHRFSIGAVVNTGRICGVLIAGRPVSRMVDQTMILEVSRVATDGTSNACSFLLGAAARIGKNMGFAKIQTFTLETESGSSLKAAGWEFHGKTNGGAWSRKKRKRVDDQPICRKNKWIKDLNDSTQYWFEKSEQTTTQQIQLWNSQ